MAGSDDLLPCSSALESVLYFYAAGALITRDELFAVGATFTLVAWTFAYAHGVPGDRAPPVKPFAPSLVMIEQVAGLAYVAMVVSRLVGLTVMRRRYDT